MSMLDRAKISRITEQRVENIQAEEPSIEERQKVTRLSLPIE